MNKLFLFVFTMFFGYSAVNYSMDESGTNMFARQFTINKKLLRMAERDDVGGIQEALNEGADINIKIYGFTPLMVAARDGKEKAVKFLLDQGADVKIENANGYTALGLAAGQLERNPAWPQTKQKNIIQMLLNNWDV